MVQPIRNVLVIGATGHQGGSVVRALLGNGAFKIRGLSKSAEIDSEFQNNDKFEHVSANLAHDDLGAVFDGIDYVFAMTDFWDPETRHKEAEIGKRIVDAAKKAGVKHFVWSTLPNAREVSAGKVDPAMFRDKAVVDEHLRSAGIPFTCIRPGFFYQNFVTLLRPKDDGLELMIPMGKDVVIDGVDANDIGAVVLPILLSPEQYAGLTVPIVAESKKLSDFVPEIERLTGKQVLLTQLDKAEFAALKQIPDAADVAEMFSWIAEFGYLGPNLDLSVCEKLAPGLRRFAEFQEINNPALGGFAPKAAAAVSGQQMAVEKAA